VHRHDAWVLEARQHPRFGPQPLGVGAETAEDLQRDLAIELAIAHAVHTSHAATPERRDHLVSRAAQIRQVRHVLKVPKAAVG